MAPSKNENNGEGFVMKYLTSSLWVLLAAAVPGEAAEPTHIPGGQLDPTIVGVDAYVGEPQPADPGSNRACQQAKTYVDLFQAGRFTEVANLFAADAVILDPMRLSVNGHVDIADFYRNKVGARGPQVVGVSYIGQGNECILELAVQLRVNGETRYVLQGLDHFTLNSGGKFSRMVVFMRPAPAAGTMLAPAGGH
jgi:hypothetical protein